MPIIRRSSMDRRSKGSQPCSPSEIHRARAQSAITSGACGRALPRSFWFWLSPSATSFLAVLLESHSGLSSVSVGKLTMESDDSSLSPTQSAAAPPLLPDCESPDFLSSPPPTPFYSAALAEL